MIKIEGDSRTEATFPLARLNFEAPTFPHVRDLETGSEHTIA
jgi:hypothetical protein